MRSIGDTTIMASVVPAARPAIYNHSVHVALKYVFIQLTNEYSSGADFSVAISHPFLV